MITLFILILCLCKSASIADEKMFKLIKVDE